FLPTPAAPPPGLYPCRMISRTATSRNPLHGALSIYPLRAREPNCQSIRTATALGACPSDLSSLLQDRLGASAARMPSELSSPVDAEVSPRLRGRASAASGWSGPFRVARI